MKKAIKTTENNWKNIRGILQSKASKWANSQIKKWANKKLRQNKMLKINTDFGHKNQYQKTHNKILKQIPTLVIKQIKQQKC